MKDRQTINTLNYGYMMAHAQILVGVCSVYLKSTTWIPYLHDLPLSTRNFIGCFLLNSYLYIH